MFEKLKKTYLGLEGGDMVIEIIVNFCDFKDIPLDTKLLKIKQTKEKTPAAGAGSAAEILFRVMSDDQRFVVGPGFPICPFSIRFLNKMKTC